MRTAEEEQNRREMTDVEKLRLENRILRAKLKDREMENELLKKLKELEGWIIYKK